MFLMSIKNKERHQRTIKEVLQGRADAQIGKNGLSHSFIENIRSLLDFHKIIKVKVLQTMSKKEVLEIAKKLSESTNSVVVETRGRTFILKTQS